MVRGASGRRHAEERGSALLLTLLATSLLATLASALVLLVITETRISGSYHRAAGLLYAAEAGLELALAELAATADWNAVLSGLASSTLTDGAPAGTRWVNGAPVDLSALTSDLRCGRRACTEAEVSAFSAVRPWGVDNPRWQLFAWGRLSHLAPSVDAVAEAYLLVWVGDDPADADGDPVRDSVDGDPGSGVVVLVAQAHGAGGMRRVVEATVTRDAAGMSPAAPLRLLAWRAMP